MYFNNYKTVLMLDQSPTMIPWGSLFEEFKEKLQPTQTMLLKDRHNLIISENTIVFVFSDCVSEEWYENEIYETFKKWASKATFVLIDPMPETLLNSTGIRTLVPVHIKQNNSIINIDFKATRVHIGLREFVNEENFIFPTILLSAKDHEKSTLKSLSNFTKGESGEIFGFAHKKRNNKGLEIYQARAPKTIKAFINQMNAVLSRNAVALILALSMIKTPLSINDIHSLIDEVLPETTTANISEAYCSGLLEVIGEEDLVSVKDKYRDEIQALGYSISETCELFLFSQRKNFEFICFYTNFRPNINWCNQYLDQRRSLDIYMEAMRTEHQARDISNS